MDKSNSYDTPTQIAGVGLEVDRIVRDSASLVDIITELGKRLIPVTRQIPESTGTDSPKEAVPNTELGRDIRNADNKITTAIQITEGIISRLEI